MTKGGFLIKIIPPAGYDVYRLHVSRARGVLISALCGLVIGAALGFHAWQLHAAENDVRALRTAAHMQHDKIRAIDLQADALARQLRAIQQQDAEIRRLLGVRAVPQSLPPIHSSLAPGGMPSAARLQARLARLARASQPLADDGDLTRLAHRVLNLRRLATIARQRMIAALPSLNPDGGTVTAGFGWRVEPWPEFHRGIDLAAGYGTPVRAAADGIVQSAGWEGGFGNKIDLDHQNGYHTWYAHLSRFAVAPGERVRKGQTIAYVGATGDATGPHLHYQVMLDGRPVDPAPYLNGIPAKILATLPSASRVQ